MLTRFLTLLCLMSLAVAVVAQTPDDREKVELTRDSFTGVFTLHWLGQTGRTYFLQHSDDLALGLWNYVPIIETGNNNAPLEWEFTADSDKGFVRLQYSDIPTANAFTADFDGDKVRNFNEVWNNTNPLSSVGALDGDFDGMADDWELFFFRTLTRNGTGDYDVDGRSDSLEYSQGTDPSDFFNGAPPQVVLISGNNQTSQTGEFLASSLVIEVRNGSGTPLANAPVSFFVSHGAGLLYQTQAGAGVARIDTIRTGSDGRASILLRLGFSSDPANKVRAGALSRFNGYKLVEFTASAEVAKDVFATGANVWLKAETLAPGVVTSWADQSLGGSNDATGTGAARPTLSSVNGFPAVSFDGTDDRLTLPAEIGSNNFTVLAVVSSAATRTATTAGTNYAKRDDGTTGQRYLFGGPRPSGASPWPTVPARPTDKRFSRWTNHLYTNTPYGRVYVPLAGNEASFPVRAQDLPVQKRYDITDNKYYNGSAYVDNPQGGWSASTCYNNFLTLNTQFNGWNPSYSSTATYNHYQGGGTSGLNDWSETYYNVTAAASWPGLTDSTQPNTSVLSQVSAGMSVGSNGVSTFDLRTEYHPTTARYDRTDTGLRVVTLRYSGKAPAIYDNGELGVTGPASLAGTVKGPQYIGSAGVAGNYFQGKVAEVLIYNTALASDDRVVVEEYLADKYKIATFDRDNDGLPDWWERQWFGDLDETSGGNPDGDGFTNAQELTRGLNPKSADTDQDGLRDDVEVNTTGTNPLLADTDGDGFPDGYEVAKPPLNPLSASDGLADLDGNGVPDGWDFINNYDRATTDTDKDGLLDWQEILIGSNAYSSADSNGDGISDRAAYLSGVSAFNLDHDGDGVLNSDELIRGTNPFLADSDGDGMNDFDDKFPLDPTRTSFGTPNPSDVTPPVVVVERPPDAQLLPP